MQLVFLLLCVPVIFVTGADIADSCGQEVLVSTGDNLFYNIPITSSSSNYLGLCTVQFSTISSNLQLTVSGNSLAPSQCQVNVYDEYNLFSKTGGNIVSIIYFTRTVTSVRSIGGGKLYLHIQGSQCNIFGLTFTVSAKQTCDSYQFQCDNGQCVYLSDQCDGFHDCTDGSDEQNCFWTVGSYVGVTIGGFAFVIIIVAVSTVYYRRRVVLLRSAVLVPPQQSTIITQSRW